MLLIAQDRKCSSHSFMPEATGSIKRPASPGQTNPLSLQRYHQLNASPASRKTLPQPGPRGLSLHDLFAAAVGGLLIAPIVWAGADFQAIEPAGSADSAPPTTGQIQADSRVAAAPGTESISSKSPNPVAEKTGFANSDSPQAIVLQWTGPNGNQWAVPLSFEQAVPAPIIKINTPLAMIGVEHAAGGPRAKTSPDNGLGTIAASNLTMKPASRHTTWPMDSDDAEKAQPKL